MFLLDVTTSAYYYCGEMTDLHISGQIIHLIHIIYLLIQIGVPLLLVIFGMLDLGKSVMAQKEDEIKKGQQMFIKRLIAAVIVFLVLFVVKLVIGLVSTDKNVTGCLDCFISEENCVQK